VIVRISGSLQSLTNGESRLDEISRRMTAPAVSALVVNHNTAVLTRSCVASLRAQRVRGPGGTEGVEVVVVDNASRPEERAALGGLDAAILWNDRNVGYGAALNQATRQSRSPLVLFSNSDTFYIPGALQSLADAIAKLPDCGAVGPRFWWDLERTFLLPPADPMTLGGHIGDSAVTSWPGWRRYRQRRWQRQALRFWSAKAAVEQSMLSGASILTRRDVVESCGGFDEGFHLYYEDTDWCFRLRKAGYRLFTVPAAEVVHLYNQSARQESATSQSLFEASAERYYRKRYGPVLWEVAAAARRVFSSHPRGWENEWKDLGRVTDPPHWSLTDIVGDEKCIALLSPLASGIPSLAQFPSSRDLSLSPSIWKQMADGPFYLQLLSLPDLRRLGKWSWTKVSVDEKANQRSRMDTTEPKIRPYRSGDEESICRLFARVFEHELSLTEWTWKYRRGDEPPASYVAEVNGDIVAHFGALRHRVLWRGEELAAWDLVDAMCERRYAGRGVFRRLALAFMEDLGDRRSLILYGFPGERHRRIGERSLGYQAVAPIYKVRKELSAAASALPPRVRCSRAIPEDWDTIWAPIEARFRLVVRRDRAHLDWRYLARPGKKYAILSVEGVAGIAVVGFESDAAYLLEFLTEGRNTAGALTLIAGIEAACHAEGARRIEGWFPPWVWETHLLAEHGGWVGAEADHWLVCPRLFDPGVDVRWLAEHFYYSLGDYDVY
jgi:GT2 family glycosyltransferase